jgi:hypothetical protein
MKLAYLDQELDRLHRASERVSANLVELEIDSGRALLAASRLEGESALRWASAGAALTELWRRSGLLEDLLAQADEARRSRQADRLQALLRGGSIELDGSEVPLAERQLLGSTRARRTCTPSELLEAMSGAFDEVKAVISDIGAAWELLIPKLDEARALLRESNELAGRLGESRPAELESAAARLAALGARVTADPLSARATEVDELTRSLQRIHKDLEGVAALQRGFETSMLEARELLGQLSAAVREADAAHREVQAKISVPHGPAPASADHELEAELREISELARREAWREARHALSNWTARTRGLLEEARAAIAANRAPVEARNQFRALLEAYQAKAARLGLVEEPQLAEMFTRAHEALYTAPTDLALAARLVRNYQQAVNGPPPVREPPR